MDSIVRAAASPTAEAAVYETGALRATGAARAESTFDTIVIGAGMSGLAAGIRLAHFEQRVCILERHSVVGGLNSYYKRRGRHYDVGLHALTNFAPKNAKHGPLPKLLRQLRIGWDELQLIPQIESAVCFPEVSLRFGNDFELLAAEVARHFPGQEAKLRALVSRLRSFDDFDSPAARVSARAAVAEVIGDPLLAEMLFCPVLFYGGTRAHDIDWGQFSILFRSIFLSGFGRPAGGVRVILKRLVEKFQELGGDLRLRAQVKRIITRHGRAVGVVLADGSELRARNVLSAAGAPETLRLCGAPAAASDAEGRMTFVEDISVLDRPPQSLGLAQTIVFYNNAPRFAYRRPDDAVDTTSGTVCVPDNFAYAEPAGHHLVRISCLANYQRWAHLGPEAYRDAKASWHERIVAGALRFLPDFRAAVTETEMYTPLTIRRFTGHEGGAVYGASQKSYDGRTPIENLYLCGTDQGLVGIIGTLLSGIVMANRWLLDRTPSRA